MTSKGLKIYSDGGSRGNPGPAAAAFVVIRDGKVIYKEYKYLGETTNNFAEHFGVLMAITWFKRKLGDEKRNAVTFFLDSQLVANQLSGKYKVKSKRLKPLVLRIKILESTLSQSIHYTSVPRDKNKLADYLVNKALDEKS